MTVFHMTNVPCAMVLGDENGRLLLLVEANQISCEIAYVEGHNLL